MSATATTTLSDTLVVSRQPQQQVGLSSLSSTSPPSFSPFPASPTHLRPLLHPLFDPELEWSRSPIHIRKPPRLGSVLAARTGKQTHIVIRPRPPLPAVCGLRVAASLGRGRTTFPPGQGPDVVFRGRASHAEGVIDSSIRRAKRQAEGRQWGRMITLTNEAYYFLPPPASNSLPDLSVCLDILSIRILIPIISKSSGLQSCLWSSATSTASNS